MPKPILLSNPVYKFKCPIDGCEKQFKRMCNYKDHVRVHTQERPFSCPVCGFGFSQMGNMTRHAKKLHGINVTIKTLINMGLLESN